MESGSNLQVILYLNFSHIFYNRVSCSLGPKPTIPHIFFEDNKLWCVENLWIKNSLNMFVIINFVDV